MKIEYKGNEYKILNNAEMCACGSRYQADAINLNTKKSCIVYWDIKQEWKEGDMEEQESACDWYKLIDTDET